MGDQAEIEKCITGKPSLNPVLDNSLTEDHPPSGFPEHTLTPSETSNKQLRHRWSREQHVSVMESYYEACIHPAETSTTKAAYILWRKQHPDVRPQIDANRLANVRRDIIKNHRLSKTELNAIKERVRSKVSNIDENCCMTNIYGNINKPFHEISNVSQQKHNEVLNDVEVAGLESPEVIQTNYFNDELVNSVRDKILQKWEILKEESIEKRNALPKIRTDKKVKQLISVTNQALNYIKEHRVLDITDVNQLIYASALVICEELGLKAWTTKTKYENTPAWKKQIEQKIQEKRSDLSILTEIMKGSFEEKKTT